MQAKIKEAAAYLRSVLKDKPKIALITGTYYNRGHPIFPLSREK